MPKGREDKPEDVMTSAQEKAMMAGLRKAEREKKKLEKEREKERNEAEKKARREQREREKAEKKKKREREKLEKKKVKAGSETEIPGLQTKKELLDLANADEDDDEEYKVFPRITTTEIEGEEKKDEEKRKTRRRKTCPWKR